MIILLFLAIFVVLYVWEFRFFIVYIIKKCRRDKSARIFAGKWVCLIHGIALVGILGTAIPGALSTANRSTMTSNQHTMAESLARSQMDYIQSQPYDNTNDPPVYDLIPDIPEPYTILTPMAARLDPMGDGTGNDDGLQELTVVVKHNDRQIFQLMDYKVNYNP